MKPVETSGRDKTRQGICSTLYQYPAHACASQRRSDIARCNVSVLRRQGDDFHSGRDRHWRPFGSDQQATRAILSEQFRVGAEASVRVDDSPRRLRPRNVSYRQLRVVGNRGAYADHDDVDQRT
jgi:hypothetical protein